MPPTTIDRSATDKRPLICRSPKAGEYVAAWRLAKERAQTGYKDAHGRPLDSTYLRALDRRINARGGLPADGGTGRRWDSDYQRGLIQDRGDLEQRVRSRVRIYQWRTDLVRRRFSHLLSQILNEGAD